MSDKNWCNGFVVGKSTHAKVNKSEERKQADRKKVNRWRDMEEKELLKKWGVISGKV